MDTDDELLLQNDGPPLEFRLRTRLVVAEKAELLVGTVYRLELKRPPLFIALIRRFASLCPWARAHWPEWFLPPTVILKKRKTGWEAEFETEKQAYDVLKPIQGTIVPHFYGEAVYDGSPALVLSPIEGESLTHLWLDLPEQVLEQQLEKALGALTSYGVHYTDMKLDNFMMLNNGRLMVFDLEQVKLGSTRNWEKSPNRANVGSIMRVLKMRRQHFNRQQARGGPAWTRPRG
ncbi:hypothetical protein N656DRAFT_720766 [Canariomyces notabilis]|uniref:Protein kinase domain-containing protein n=1 Tax=Canariomyces notabilis TaxID=2074819 RepID=A0AAN6QCM3_9PEZI|nr:hypothetical protein N656DRAFT_720766 [Canariomyces arenarius]